MSKEQHSALINIKLLYKSREVVIKLISYYSSIVSEAKYKTIHGKEIPSILACIACLAKVSDHSNLKILAPNQIAYVQVKAGNKSNNLLNQIRYIIYSLYRAKEITKQVPKTTMNSINL